MTDKIKVIISNKQKTVKIPTGVRMLVRRCCNAVLAMEQFEELRRNQRVLRGRRRDKRA